ncbi:HAMP domain-containing histidine kinase [Streptosporangiaceae bacterium NEAU-GS5]|nr:HAMP domain-containing histidine kinase [Streptosporangiaceae bacterium NEAU-GS5]
MTTLTGAVMALVCAGMTLVVLLGVRNIATEYRTEQIVDAALRTVHLVKRNQLPSILPYQNVRALQVVDAHQIVRAATPNLIGREPIADFPPDENSVRGDRVWCHMPAFPDECMIVVAFRIYQSKGDWTIYAADEGVPWYVDLRAIVSLIIGSLLLTGVTTIGAYWQVGKVLEPVEAIRRELFEYTATDPGRRVPVPRYHDEIRELTLTANKTLERLEAAVEQQRRFASDASHDLRSPLTAMRAEIEAALLDPDQTDWTATGNALIDSLDRLQALVSDLLQIARLDAAAPGANEPIDLAELCRTEVDARQRTVELVQELAPGVVVQGDRLRLSRLLTNLLDNAERHAASEVRVCVCGDNGWGVLEVIDDGSGIPPAQREVVFQRFARLDAARTRDAGGTGLGLSIARQIAEGHGGTLTIEDSDRGARFVLRIPRTQ